MKMVMNTPNAKSTYEGENCEKRCFELPRSRIRRAILQKRLGHVHLKKTKTSQVEAIYLTIKTRYI